MKIHHFGLWFHWLLNYPRSGREWVSIPPLECPFLIYYDGHYLGEQWVDFDLTIYDDEPHIIRLKNKFPFRENYKQTYALDRPITLDDFEIVKNPDYRGDQ